MTVWEMRRRLPAAEWMQWRAYFAVEAQESEHRANLAESEANRSKPTG